MRTYDVRIVSEARELRLEMVTTQRSEWTLRQVTSDGHGHVIAGPTDLTLEARGAGAVFVEMTLEAVAHELTFNFSSVGGGPARLDVAGHQRIVEPGASGFWTVTLQPEHAMAGEVF